MNGARGTLLVLGMLTFLGCQQTQEDAADDAEGTTVVKEKETVVQPPAESKPDVDVDVNTGGDQGAAGGEAGAEGQNP